MVQEKKEKILFVDDEESILEIAGEYFQRKGYDVLTARNGFEAVKIIDNENVDCCFTDINMPQMDGLELAERIRLKDNTLPVIIMTGYPSLENTIRTLKNGVVDFLIKPVNLSQMELCVERVLRERQLFAENILLKKEVESKARIEKLNRELSYKVEELRLLNKIMSGFSSLSTSAQVFTRIVEMATEITPAEQACFYLINESIRDPFRIAAAECCTKQGQAETVAQLGGQLRQKDTQAPEPIAALIKEIAADEIPLLIANNNKSVRRLSPQIHSFMAVPLKIREKVFGVLTGIKRNGPEGFSEKDLYYMSSITANASRSIENLALYENIYDNLFATMYAFVKAIEARDPYTQQHSNRVTAIAVAIGEHVGLSSEELEVLKFAGPLHDIGKIGVRDDILLKPGKLTNDEYEKIKAHPAMGAEIVAHLGLWDKERQIIHNHHERFDGKGYPDGLAGEQIPLLARILSVADAYDAMASDRAYRRRMPQEKIINIMTDCSGSQFDPDVVKVFLELHRQDALPSPTG